MNTLEQPEVLIEQLQERVVQLKRENAALRQSEARYRQCFENAPISLCFSSTEGELMEMNSAAENFLGYTIAQAKESGFNPLAAPTLVENGTATSMQRAIAGETVIEPPMFFDPSSTIGRGQWKWVQGHYYPIRDEAGQVQEIVEIALDLTEMYKVQQGLAEERNRAIQEKLAELEAQNRLLENRDRILESTATATNALLTVENFDKAVNAALKIIGECLDTDRVNVIENFDQSLEPLPWWRVLYEWDSAYTPSQLLHADATQGRYEDIQEWYEQLIQGQSVISHLLEEMPELLRIDMAKVGVKATHVVPIFVEDKFWGIIGFDDCREAKRRSPAELSVLKIAANCIGSAIERDRTQQALLQAEQARSQELERYNAELQQTLDRLAESEQRYRQLLELASEGIFRVEYEEPISVALPVEEQAKQIYQQFRYVEHNLAFAQMYGYDQADALVGTSLAHVMDAPENAVQMEQFVRNGHQMRNQETVELDRFGHKRHFLNNGFSIIRDGYAIGAWGTQIDITALRETQQALLEAEQERATELEYINAELRQREHGLQRSYGLLSLVAQVNKNLLKIENLKIAIPAVLQIVGKTVNINRVVLILERKDPATQRLQHYAAYEWVKEGTNNHYSVGLSVMDNEDFQILIQPLYEGQVIQRVVDDVPEITRQKFEKLGIKSTGIVPIFIKGQYVGCLAFSDCVILRHWSQQEIDVLTAVAESIGAAIHRKQLVDQLIEERIRAEQERVAELAQANEVVQRSIERMSQDCTLDVLLSYVLVEAVSLSNACGGGLFVRQSVAEAGFRPVAVVENGVLRAGEDWLTHDGIEGFVERSAADETGFFQRLAQGEINYMRVDEPDPLWWTDSIAYHQQLGHRVVMHLPMVLHGEVLGLFALCFKQIVEPKPEMVEYLTTLAKQATLALELTRLAEEAKQAAIAREQEKAAQERAAELAKANEALRRGVERLAEAGNIDVLLDSFLLEALGVTGASAGAVMDRVSGTEFQLRSLAQDGMITRVSDTDAFGNVFREVTARDPVGALRQIVEGQVYCHEVDDYFASWFPEAAVYHRQQGHQVCWNFPFRVGKEVAGYLGIAFREKRLPNQIMTETVQALAHQVSLALETLRLAEEAKQAAIAREQEEAAQKRVAELAKANDALQSMIDAMAEIDGLDEFVPAVLQIVAQTFQTDNCAFYEHSIDEIVYLRYWLFGNRVLCPEELLTLDGDCFATIRRLAGGFTVPNTYLGSPVQERTQAVILDHLARTPDTEFDKFTCANNWHMELNVPLVVDGCADGALVIYRSAGEQFTPAEVTLAESLGKQLALAMQANRLAVESKSKAVETAIAREQEKADQERAAELAKANEALQSTINALASVGDLDEFVPAALQIVGKTFGTENCAFYEHYANEPIYLRYWMMGDRVLRPADLLTLDGDFFAVVHQLVNGFTVPNDHLGTPVRERTKPVILDHTIGTSVPEFHEFACKNGWDVELNVPLVINGFASGALLIFRLAGATFTPSEIALAETLGQQLALAMQASRLAAEGKARAVEAAIAREQEKAAKERAAELAKANEALQNTVAALANRHDLDGFIGEILHTLAVEFESPLVEYWQTLEPDTVEVDTWLYNHQLLSLKQGNEHPSRGGIRILSEFIDFDDLTHREQIFIRETPMPAYSLALEQIICPTDWYAALGVSKHFNFPLNVGESTVGSISVWLPAQQQMTEECLRLGQALSHQTALAIQLTRLAEEAKQAAIFEERNRMARDIHDALAQSLTGVVMQLNAATEFLTSQPNQTQACITRAQDLAKQGLAEARRSVWLLYHSDLTASGLSDSLTRLVEQMTTSTTRIILNIEGTPCCLDAAINMNLLRIAQESLTNALRHAQPQTIHLQLTYTPQQIQLRVRDDGCGFDPQQTAGRGLGLVSMGDRAKAIGAQLQIESKLGIGTETIVTVAIASP